MIDWMRGSRLGHRGERAQSTAEFVVVFPMLMLLFFLMLEFGWLMKNWIVVTNSVREAGRCAIVSNCDLSGTGPVSPQQLLLNRIRQGITNNLEIDNTLPSDDVDIHYIDVDGNNAATPGDILIVCVRAGNKAITPLLAFASMANILPNPIPIVGREQMLIEDFGLDPSWGIQARSDDLCSFA